MEYRVLGNTGIKVSRICFGSLTVGPLQANLPLEEGAKVIAHGLDSGINFIDTAELYDNYNYIKRALEIRKSGHHIAIASKCYAYDRAGAEYSLNLALDQLGIKKIDIFMLHEQESYLTLKGHKEALDYFRAKKEEGIIGALGLSTHTIEGVMAACDNTDIEVIHPIVNIDGLGIGDGTIEEMLSAIEIAYNKGKGIYSMKPLGGGNLIKRYDQSIKFVLDIPYIHSVAIGMQSEDEIEANISIFEGREVDSRIAEKLRAKVRRLDIAYWCRGCGNCLNNCSHRAIVIEDGKAVVNKDQCVICGYCSKYCPDFCIKVI